MPLRRPNASARSWGRLLLCTLCMHTCLSSSSAFASSSSSSTTDVTTSADGTSSKSTTYHEAVTVSMGTGIRSYHLFQKIIQSYALARPDVIINLQLASDEVNRETMQYNTNDLATVGVPFSPLQQATQPDTTAFPVFADGIVPVYNIPGMDASFRLVMSVMTMCQIFTGNVTNWNDPRIALENPGYNLPNLNITVVLRQSPFPDTAIFSHACNRTFPYFGTLMTPNVTLTFPTQLYVNYIVGDANGGDPYYLPVATVLHTSGAFTYSTFAAANDLKTSTALMINQASAIVECTQTALTIAATERGVGTSLTEWSDCSLGQSASAWPLCGYNFVLLNQVKVVSTCETKKEAYNFLNYMLTTQTVANIATYTAILSSAVRSTAPPPGIYCNGELLGVATTDSAIFAGSSLMTDFLTNTLKFYANTDATRTYSFAAADHLASMRQVLNGEIDVAVVPADLVRASNPTEWYNIIHSGDVRVLPAFTMALSPTFHLPDDVVALQSSTFKYADAYGGGVGVQFRMSTTLKIFMGQISKWNDPTILALNPALAERYAYAKANNIALNPNITLVICCTAKDADQSITSMFFYTLYQSIYRSQLALNATIDTSWFSAVPFSWNSTTLVPLAKSSHYFMVAYEQQLDVTVTQISGAISYHLLTAKPVITTDITWNQLVDFYNVSGPTVQVYALPENQLRILDYAPLQNDSADWNDLTLPVKAVDLDPLYWPLTVMLNLVTMSHYESASYDVMLVNKTLNVVDWLLFSDTLDTAMAQSNMAQISNANSYVGNRAKHQLNYITCAGKTCLITLPNIWTLNGAVTAFGYAGAVIGLLLTLGTFASLYIFRARTVYRSASIVFLALINLGLMCMFLAAIPLVQSSPSAAACSGFAWLTDLGLLFTFTPLFLKMYRIYKIFNRQQLKVVKLTNLKLFSYFGVIGLVELILLAAWQGESPLRPITAHVWQGVLDNQYTQCNVDSSGQTYVILLGAIKAGMLLFGMVMSFSTRKVSSTFNESSSVGWSIYNAIFASVIIIAIIAFVGTQGDTLVLMELLLVFWISYSTWGLIFATKLFTIAQGEKAEQFSHLESQRTMTGGFSFVSVDALTKATITQYLTALEQHCLVVRRKKATLDGTAAGGTSALNGSSGLHGSTKSLIGSADGGSSADGPGWSPRNSTTTKVLTNTGRAVQPNKSASGSNFNFEKRTFVATPTPGSVTPTTKYLPLVHRNSHGAVQATSRLSSNPARATTSGVVLHSRSASFGVASVIATTTTAETTVSVTPATPPRSLDTTAERSASTPILPTDSEGDKRSETVD